MKPPTTNLLDAIGNLLVAFGNLLGTFDDRSGTFNDLLESLNDLLEIFDGLWDILWFRETFGNSPQTFYELLAVFGDLCNHLVTFGDL